MRRWSLGIRTISGSWSTTSYPGRSPAQGQESQVEPAASERFGEIRRKVAGDRDLDVLSSSRSTCIACGSQFISCPVWKPMANVSLPVAPPCVPLRPRHRPASAPARRGRERPCLQRSARRRERCEKRREPTPTSYSRSRSPGSAKAGRCGAGAGRARPVRLRSSTTATK